VVQGQDDVDAQIAELRKWFRIEQEPASQGVRLTLYPYRVTVTAPTYGFACSKLIWVMEGRYEHHTGKLVRDRHLQGEWRDRDDSSNATGDVSD